MTVLSYLVIHSIFVSDVYMGNISEIKISPSPFTFGAIFIQQRRSEFTNFMLQLICLYFSWYIFVDPGKIANIQC